MNLQVLGRVTDQIGYLVLNESGATVASGGDLENDEHTAEVIYSLVSLADKVDGIEGFNKLSVCFKNYCYVICLSNKKIHVVKRKFTPSATPVSGASAELHPVEMQVPITNSINA